MERGFIAEATHGATLVSAWTPGEPVKRRWVGIQWKWNDKRNIAIVTYRCARCGYLESFAPALSA